MNRVTIARSVILALITFSALTAFTTSAQAAACPRITEVDIANNMVTISNIGDATSSGTFWLCARFSYTSFSLNLAAGESVTIPSQMTLNTTSSDLGLYNSASFTSTAAMEDFVEWGAANIGRHSVAVSKGIWSSTEFVDLAGGSVIVWSGANCVDTGASFWSGPVATSVANWSGVKALFR